MRRVKLELAKSRGKDKRRGRNVLELRLATTRKGGGGGVGSEGDYVKRTTYAMDSEKGGAVRGNGGPYTPARTVPGGPSILP